MPDSKNDLVNEAIDASIEFEELMDKTDFDSWLKTDENNSLKKLGQQINPFVNYKKNKNILINICDRMRNRGDGKFPNLGDKSFLEKFIIYNLFESKNKRIEARICFNKEDEEKEYKQSRYHLLSAIYALKNPKAANVDGRWLILIYNDLSICVSGLENSSLSRGYAEEATRIIKEEKSYKNFEKNFRVRNSTNLKGFKEDEFVSSKSYYLYIIALFNQALAERHLSLYSDAEINFKKIINYAENDKYLLNFNYYSACVSLSDLFIDQGRCKEAIELLEKVIDSIDEDDVRYWKAYLHNITAFIDQSEWDDAEDLLKNKLITKKRETTLKIRHRITSTGFIGINHFARYQIEKAEDTLNRDDKKNDNELKIAENILIKIIPIIIKRNQKGLEKKTYKHLSEIYRIMNKYKESIKYLTKYISNGEIYRPRDLIKDKRTEKWIDDCDDLDVLENLSEEICKYLERDGRYLIRAQSTVLFIKSIKEKIIRECDAKCQLSRAERIVKKLNKALGKRIDIKYREGIFSEERSGDEGNLTKEDIIKRLDINEKDFDSVLFGRSNIKKRHIVEVIVLRRWNSFSPGLFKESKGSLGGGYLIRINRDLGEGNDIVDEEETSNVENIVIDPGFNFLENFRTEGFCINDIDTIIITHSHLDHCAELMSIMDLLYQFNKRYESTSNSKRHKKRVNLCLSQGAYKKFSSFANEGWQEQLKDIILIENLENNKWKPFEDLGLTISAIKTPHMDLGGVNAIGIRIEIERVNDKELIIGFTGDTPWDQKIKEHFIGCDLLCVHLGSIKYQEIGYTDDRYGIKGESREISKRGRLREREFDETYLKADHLLFFGTGDVIRHCAKKKENNLIIVSEFGEELKYGLRVDLCEKLNKMTSIDCIPGDIGLNIAIEKDGTQKVRCSFCEEFVGQKEINIFIYGKEDAINYICETCNNTLSQLQKQALIEHRVTRH